MIYKKMLYLFLALFFMVCEIQGEELIDKNVNLPNDIRNFIESREALNGADKVNSTKTISEKERIKYNQKQDLKQKEIDKEFVALRKKYKENGFIMNILSQYSCLLNDCSATSKGDGFVFYKNVDIAEAIYASLVDKTTLVSYPFFEDIFTHNPNILAQKENFTLNLSSSIKYGNYKKIDIVWSQDKTRIDFILYDEYFNKNICSHTASFTRFEQQTNGVKASFGYMKMPYTQAKEVNDFINKSCDCIYVGGEEPYDEQHANELKEMAQGCNDISKMRLILQKKYKDDINLSVLLQREEQNYKEAFGESQ